MDDWLIEKLEQMRNAAIQACDFIEAMTKAEFLADKRTQQACAMNLIILGEFARRVCERYPELTTQELTI